MTFDELNLAPAILKAVREHGYETPTPIQAQAIPIVLEGRDVLGGAQTGTGKTAAFTLPILHKLSMSRSATNASGGLGIRALVLTPTRELAAQVQESARTYGKYLQLTSTVVFGGVGIHPQMKLLKAGVDILVATPGRLLDLHQQGAVDLSQVQILVLDEADRMLDMGFIYDVKKILALLPAAKQSLLFSATFSDEIRDLANNLLKDPLHIQVTPRNTTVERIAQVVIPVGRAKKKQLLAHLINENNWSQVLVFTRTKFGANHVAEALEKAGISAMALHGNKSQSARTQALEGFKKGEVKVLVATDIAARGIDIDELPHVVNYEIPNVVEDYVHRIGRTGRAGASGEAINLMCLDEEGFMAEIELFTKQSLPRQPVEGFGADEGERAEPIAMGRQTLWGGLGRPPSREVMAAAARAARTEMLQRVRERKGPGTAGAGAANSNGQRPGLGNRGPRPVGQGQDTRPQDPNALQSRDTRGPRGPRDDRNGPGPRNHRGPRPGGFNANQPPYANLQNGQGLNGQNRFDRPRRPPTDTRVEGGLDGDFADDDFQPRHVNHSPGLGVGLDRRARLVPAQKEIDGQPNPLRTSVDSYADRNKRNGPPKGPRNPMGAGPGGPGGFPAGPKRSAGGGKRPRGPAGPNRTFER